MQRFKNILVRLDTSFENNPALDWGRSLAEHNQAKLKLVDVVREFPWFVRLSLPDHESVRKTLAHEKETRLDALAEMIRMRGIDVEVKVLMGATSVEIVREVMQADHDLVVCMAKGVHSRRPGFIGTTSMRLLRKCPCPVWLVRPDGEPTFKRVLAAVDATPEDDAHSELNQAIMELAVSIAHYQDAECHVVYTWDIFGDHLLRSRMSEDEYQAMKEEAGTKMWTAFDSFLGPYREQIAPQNTHLLEGDPGHLIPLLAKDKKVDLVVMGTIARLGVPGLLMGNTAEMVLDRVECPVLAIKPEGFKASLTGIDEP